jgi:hypothetical protein
MMAALLLGSVAAGTLTAQVAAQKSDSPREGFHAVGTVVLTEGATIEVAKDASVTLGASRKITMVEKDKRVTVEGDVDMNIIVNGKTVCRIRTKDARFLPRTSSEAEKTK